MTEKGPLPTHHVLAHDADANRLVDVGVGWSSVDKHGRTYISIQLNARPWGTWDGKLQVHGIHVEKEPKR